MPTHSLASLAVAAVLLAAIGCRSPQPASTAEVKPMKIVCLGDSITGQPNLRRYLKWSSILECMLQAHYGDPAIQVINRGIGGDTTIGAVRRLQGDVLDLHPDVVVILLGGNDAGQKRPRADVKADLTTIVAKCRGIGAKVLLMQYHVLPPPEHPETAWDHLNDNNPVIAEVASEQGVPLLNLAHFMEDALAHGRTSELQGRDKSGIATWQDVPISQEHLASAKDGVHLNPAGELVFARAIYAKLQELGWVAP